MIICLFDRIFQRNAYNLQIRQTVCFALSYQRQKSVETYSSLAPRVEAVGMPYSSERATTTPSQYIYHNNPQSFISSQDAKARDYPNTHTHERLSLPLSFDEYESFLRFQHVKNKARDIRCFHKWYPQDLQKDVSCCFYAIVLAYWYEDGAKLEIISDTCKSMFIFFCFDIMLRNPLFRFLFVF